MRRKERRGWFAMIGQLGAPVGFVLAASLFAYLYGSLSTSRASGLGLALSFFVAFAINVVALFARLRLVVGAVIRRTAAAAWSCNP